MSCGVELLVRESYAPCNRSVHFGCLDDSTMWVTGGCRGRFQCGRSPSGQTRISCGYPGQRGIDRDTCACREPLPPWRPPAAWLPSVYVYTGHALNHNWLRKCPGFEALQEGPLAENLAEVQLLRALQRHRVHDPTKADLFFVPVFEFASWKLGRCEKTTHASRMRQAHTALSSSASWQQHRGERHVFASSAYSTNNPAVRSVTIERLDPLSSDLLRGIAGRYKVGLPPHSRVVSNPNCVVEAPYALPRAVRRTILSLWPITQTPTLGPRKVLLFFAGSIDVCCSGKAVRCAIGDLVVRAQCDGDVLVRMTGTGPCTRRTKKRLRESGACGGRKLGEAAIRSARPQEEVPSDRYGFVNRSQVELTATQMASATFCLVPAGDTIVTSRLYWAMALGCLPVVLDLAGGRPGAFAEEAQYDSFWIQGKRFEGNPTALLKQLRSIPSDEIRRRQVKMLEHRADVLYEHPVSRVGVNFLRAAGRTECARPSASSSLGK